MMKIIVFLALFYYVQVFNLEGFEYSWTIRRIKKNEEFQGFEASVGGEKIEVILGLDRRFKYDDIMIKLIIN